MQWTDLVPASFKPVLRQIWRPICRAISPWFLAYLRFRDEREAAKPPAPTRFGFQLAGPARTKRGEYEAGEIEVFLQLLERSDVCVDVGANVGLYSCLAASHGKHTVAVEPLDSNLKILYKNLVCNGFLDVEVYPLGLSSKAGIQRLYGAGINASFVRGWARAAETSYQIVPVTTLDILVGDRFEGIPLIIKLDVEGHEFEVLKGASRTLSLTPKPVWLVEIVLTEQVPGGINERFCEIFEIFWRHGYQSRIADSSQRPVRPEDVSRWLAKGTRDFGSYNYLFVER
jgi:FkbM family methyltransferase